MIKSGLGIDLEISMFPPSHNRLVFRTPLWGLAVPVPTKRSSRRTIMVSWSEVLRECRGGLVPPN